MSRIAWRWGRLIGSVYSVMVLVATLPGALVPVLAWFRETKLPQRNQPPLPEEAAHA